MIVIPAIYCEQLAILFLERKIYEMGKMESLEDRRRSFRLFFLFFYKSSSRIRAECLIRYEQSYENVYKMIVRPNGYSKRIKDSLLDV